MAKRENMKKYNGAIAEWDKHLAKIEDIDFDLSRGVYISYKGKVARAKENGLAETVFHTLTATRIYLKKETRQVGYSLSGDERRRVPEYHTRVYWAHERSQEMVKFSKGFNSPTIKSLYKEASEKLMTERKALIASAREVIKSIAKELAHCSYFRTIFIELRDYGVLDEELEEKLLSLNEELKAEEEREREEIRAAMEAEERLLRSTEAREAAEKAANNEPEPSYGLADIGALLAKFN